MGVFDQFGSVAAAAHAVAAATRATDGKKLIAVMEFVHDETRDAVVLAISHSKGTELVRHECALTGMTPAEIGELLIARLAEARMDK